LVLAGPLGDVIGALLSAPPTSLEFAALCAVALRDRACEDLAKRSSELRTSGSTDAIAMIAIYRHVRDGIDGAVI
jgi:hypothetical protein